MPALNHALMIPGLIVVTLLFWAWIPVWALVRCMRRCTKGRPSDEERLQTGHVPHKGFEPPSPEEVIEFLPPQDFADSTPLLSEKHQYKDQFDGIDAAVEQEKKRERRGREDGIKTVEARMQKRQEEEERAAAVMKEQTRRHREERRERREREEAERRREKGKGRALSFSEQSMMDSSSAVTAPESVVTRKDSRRHHHSRR